MRKLKFRAWDKEKEVMVDVGVFEESACFLEGGFGGLVTSNMDIMQFTGLVDTNGVEIYEGDIITHNIYTKASGRDEKSNPKPVFWDITKCGFETNGAGSYKAGMFYEEYTVIGNIYQNKELLK